MLSVQAGTVCSACLSTSCDRLVSTNMVVPTKCTDGIWQQVLISQVRVQVQVQVLQTCTRAQLEYKYKHQVLHVWL